MRIISGSHKGKQLFPDKNFKARPTTDFAKENLFNVLNNYIPFEGSKVLDLFSGTGSISYEFASRGADEVVAIEMNYHHYAFIKRMIAELGFKCIQLFRTDVFIACKKLQGRTFDIIFADPPYDLPHLAMLPTCIFENGLLSPSGVAIIEHPSTIDFSHMPYFYDHRQYGSVNFSFFRY